MTAPKPVSIVINTLNRANLLKNTLQSLQYLDYENFEVVVVDGSSTDETDHLLKTWQGNIKIGRCPDANISKSRNIGIAMSCGDFIAFIDDDAIPEPEWLSQAVAAFDTDEIAAAGGKVFDRTGYRFQYEYANADRLGHGKWKLSKAYPHYCFPMSFEFPYLQGTNAVFRRYALLEIGGFDEEFEYYLDETDVCLRLIDAGYVIRQLPNAFVHHKFAPSHIRNDRTVLNHFAAEKSKIYFSNRHGARYKPIEEIDADNQAFIQHYRNDVQQNVALGLLAPAYQIQFERDAQRAWVLAKDAASKPAKLIGRQTIQSHKSKYKAFPILRAKSDRLTVILLCEDYPPELLGGIARFTQTKAQAMAAMGHNVHVIARSNSSNSVDFEDGVWVHRIVAKGQPLAERAAALKVPQSHWDQSRTFLDEIDRISTHRHVDIVEAPIWNVPGIAVLLSGRYKLVTSLQTTLKLSLPSRPDLLRDENILKTLVDPLVALEHFVIAHSDRVLAISHGIAEEVETAYGLRLDPMRLTVSYLGMPDWAKTTSAKPPVDRDQKLAILFVGRLEKRKGIDVLLEIIPRLCAKYPHLHFDIVGDDAIPMENGETYRKIFEGLHANLLGLQVQFHGKLSDEQLKAKYAACDIFVAPSRFESFGLIFLEAMIFAKPVVACVGGGTSEIVLDGKTGLLAEPGNAESLYQAVERLINNEALRVQLGREGRRRYEELFSDREMARNSLKLYYGCLSAQGSTSEMAAQREESRGASHSRVEIDS